MSDLSVIIKVTSKNQQVITTNQLVLIKSDSSTTCYDVLNSLSQQSPLLQHILTYVRHYTKSNSETPLINEQKNDTDNNNTPIIIPSTDHIDIVAFKEDSDQTIKNVPINKALYPLLNRHKWNLLQFLISDQLMIQSQLFLSNIIEDSNSQLPAFNQQNFPSFSKPIPEVKIAEEGITANTKEFHYKRFHNRTSPITAPEFSNMAEITSLYHICFAVLIVFLTGILTNEALEKGVVYNFELLRWNFGQADKVFLIWCAMFAYSFLFVVLFHQYRLRSIDRLNFGTFYFFLLVPLIYCPFQMIRYLNLPIASAAVIACEQIRFVMKIHAYIFEMFRALHFGQIFHNNISISYVKSGQNGINEYKYLETDWSEAWNQCMKVSQIPHQSKSGYSTPTNPTKSYDYTMPGTSPMPQNIIHNSNTSIPIAVQIAHYPYPMHVHSFLNFIFCPSLVYRWSYPTLKINVNGDINYKIRWSNVFGQLINFGGCLLFVFVVFYVFICPLFVNTPYEQFTMSSFLSLVFSSAIPGMLLVIMCFLGVTHCWLNMWSELTGYCDRIFYEDWWNANTFASYTKKWNLVVYNWSYNYFFLPMLEAGYPKATADLFTFWLWAAMQEYVFWASSGCFYPVLLCSCGIYGVLFYSIPFTDSSSLRYHQDSDSTNRRNDAQKGEEKREEESGVWNVFLWIMLFLINGFFVTLYAREWYAHNAYLSGHVKLDENSWMPYSWQIAFYPNGTRI